MKKTLEIISEVIRHPRPLFRKNESQTRKSSKHRYERRKVNEMIRLGDWNGSPA